MNKTEKEVAVDDTASIQLDEGLKEEVNQDASAVRLRLHEAHFVPLRAQSNIYSVVPLRLEGRNKIVVATIRGEISYLEFHNPSTQRPPSFTQINFTYIPGEHVPTTLPAVNNSLVKKSLKILPEPFQDLSRTQFLQNLTMILVRFLLDIPLRS